MKILIHFAFLSALEDLFPTILQFSLIPFWLHGAGYTFNPPPFSYAKLMDHLTPELRRKVVWNNARFEKKYVDYFNSFSSTIDYQNFSCFKNENSIFGI